MEQDRVREVPLTYDDYRIMPDEERYELIEGELLVTPAPSPKHQQISLRILMALVDHVQRHQRGQVWHAPLDVVLSETNVIQPDLFFIAKTRAGIVKDECVEGAPDLVVEILSPSTAQRDLVIKRELYARFGVRECWIVDPKNQTIEVCVHTGQELTTARMYQRGMALVSPLLEGFELNLDSVFQWGFPPTAAGGTPMSKEDLVRTIRDALQGVEGLAAAYLFGSVARGEASSASDIDIALLFAPEVDGERRLYTRIDIAQSLEEKLGRSVDVADVELLPPHVAHQVLTDKVLLLGFDSPLRVEFEKSVRRDYFDMEPRRRQMLEASMQRLREGRALGGERGAGSRTLEAARRIHQRLGGG